jgi:tetratricopeptide (TPR) repeat protein
VSANYRHLLTSHLIAAFVLAILLLTTSFAQKNGAESGHPGQLGGRVLGSQKQPMPTATLYLQSQNGNQTWVAVTDARGNYVFSAIPGGTYGLRVRTNGTESAQNSITIADGEKKYVDVMVDANNALQLKPAELPQFYDQPEFTVAGVSDTTNLGGHGSGVETRTKEILATDVANLGASHVDRAPVPSTSEKRLRDAAEHDPRNFEINSQLGKLLLESGEAREAIPYLERAALANSGDHKNAYELAQAYKSAGDYGRARKTGRALLALNNTAELHHLLAEIEEQSGDPLQAVREYQTAAEMQESEAYLFDWASELLVHRAVEPSLTVFTKGNRLFPNSLRMLEGLAVALYASGSYDEAILRLCQASDAHVEDASPYLLMGKILSAESASSKTMNAKLERFAAVQPRNPMALYYYALSLSKLGNGAEDPEERLRIESLLQEAVKLDPKLGSAYLQMGVIRSQVQDLPGAIAAYEQAIYADGGLTEAHYRLAQAYRLSGDTAKSQSELRIYERLSKQEANADERRRHETQQFVYKLRGSSPVTQREH